MMMNDTLKQNSPVPSTLEDGSALPELQQAILDRATVDQLFKDIEHCTEVLEVIPKFSKHGYVNTASLGLEQGRQLLERGELRALQLRYRYAGSEWWDTLMAAPGGLRLVRIQHQF
jgi:hypothetical protein